MRTNKIVCIVCLLSSVLAISSFAVGATKSAIRPYDIVKVSLKEMKDQDFGRTPHRIGKGNVFFDRFESSSTPLSPSEQGQSLIVEWKASQLSSAGEKIRLHLEYRTIDIPEVKTKDLDIDVDKTGFFETPIDHLGEEFQKEGPFESWKVSLMSGNVVLDHEVSATWSEPKS